MGSAVPGSASVALAENLRGAGYMVGCMAGFASNDACMKSLAGAVSISQGLFVRGVIATPLIGALAWRKARCVSGRGGATRG